MLKIVWKRKLPYGTSAHTIIVDQLDGIELRLFNIVKQAVEAYAKVMKIGNGKNREKRKPTWKKNGNGGMPTED